MTTLLLRGHRTWAKIPARGRPAVILLHGAMSSSRSLLRSIGPGLSKWYHVGAFDRRGHGRTGDTSAPFSYEDMAEETVAFLDFLGRRVHLVGHSDGANVALLVARQRPDLLKRMVVVGANYHFSGLIEFTPLDARGSDFDQWAIKYGALAPEGITHAARVLAKTNELLATGPTMTLEELRTILVPTLVMAGDDDVATFEHTASLFEALPHAQLAIVPGTSHALLKERTSESVRIIRHFLRSELPAVTLSPVRRRGEAPK